MSKVKNIENPEEKAVKYWQKTSEEWLVGRKIVKCRYMSDKEMKESYWHSRPLCILLDDGTWIIQQCDDEGNDGGVLYVANAVKDKDETIPVI